MSSRLVAKSAINIFVFSSISPSHFKQSDQSVSICSYILLLSSLNPSKTYRQYLCTDTSIRYYECNTFENNYMAKQWSSFESSTHGCKVAKKAFDTLEWAFINKALEFFNFGPVIRRWISLLYCNVESGVINAGVMTNYFRVSRGERQGCPLSPLLFVLAVEILASKVRHDEFCRSINLPDNKESKYISLQTTNLNSQ